MVRFFKKGVIKIFAVSFILTMIFAFLLLKGMEKRNYDINNKIPISISAGIINSFFIIKYSNVTGFSSFLIQATLTIIIIIMFIDIKYLEIPDELNLALFSLGITNLIYNYPQNVWTYLKGSLIAFAIFFFLAIITKGGLGGGDIKMIASLGLITGLQDILFIIYISYMIGAVVGITLIITKKKKLAEHLAFAPYISISTVIMFMFNPQIQAFVQNWLNS